MQVTTIHRLLAFAIVAPLAGFTFAQSTAPATLPATTAPAQHDAAFWETLTHDMQLAAQAQRDLKAVTTADHDKLKQLADTATDPDIKSQLLARLAELDEEIVTNPAPISLDIKDASLIDVCEALKNATHVPIQPPRNTAPGSGTFTLSCKDKSFWEVFAQLSEQHPLVFQTYDGFRLEHGQTALHRFFPAQPGFAVFPIALLRAKSVNPQKPESKQSEPLQLNFTYSVAVDPRIKVIRYSPAYLTEVKDDAGNELLIDHTPQTYLNDNQQGQCLFEQGTGLAVPANIGKKIATIKGEAHFLIQLAQTRMDVDPKTNMNKPIQVGDQSVTITQFQINNGTINFQVQSQGDNGQSGTPALMEFVDANDTSIWSTRLNGGSGGDVGGNFTEPIKIRFTIAKKTKMLTVPFEMKDLPLP